jgi:hypothetical protein
MNILTRGILGGVLNRIDPADLARLPASYRYAGGGLMSRIATAGILRLALRWPALSVAVILSALAARIVMGRREQGKEVRPALRGA